MDRSIIVTFVRTFIILFCLAEIYFHRLYLPCFMIFVMIKSFIEGMCWNLSVADLWYLMMVCMFYFFYILCLFILIIDLFASYELLHWNKFIYIKIDKFLSQSTINSYFFLLPSSLCGRNIKFPLCLLCWIVIE